MKLIVWDLFGGGQNSVYNALDPNKYEVYTFDITEPTHEHQYHLDLSQRDIVDKFKDFPKPDIIVASPLCQSFSCVLSMKGGGTCFWKLNDDKTLLVERSIKEFEKLKHGFTKHLNSRTQLFIKRLGQRCIDNTIKLIDYYQPKVWYIENPKHSLIWKYLELNNKEFCSKWHTVKNEASYGKYGFLTTKPTYFMSNVSLDLENGRIPKPYHTEVLDGVKYYVLGGSRSKCELGSGIVGINAVKARPSSPRLAGLDFLEKSNKKTNSKNKMTTEQIGEASEASHIPPQLISNIFWQFDCIINSGWLF